MKINVIENGEVVTRDMTETEEENYSAWAEIESRTLEDRVSDLESAVGDVETVFNSLFTEEE